MPIDDYDGNTFVAFLDISGFKTLMYDEQRALRALSRFYQAGYSVLKVQNNVGSNRVDGFFISDCGILFVRSGNEGMREQLESMLSAVERINRRLLHHDLILTTSISYGRFTYHGRMEFPGIEKNPIYGDGYVSAFLDNENGSPKIQPGQCRVVKRNLPPEFGNLLTDNESTLLKRVKDSRKHYYFYWMVGDEDEIEDFEKHYADAYDLKYAGMLRALKRVRTVNEIPNS